MFRAMTAHEVLDARADQRRVGGRRLAVTATTGAEVHRHDAMHLGATRVQHGPKTVANGRGVTTRRSLGLMMATVHDAMKDHVLVPKVGLRVAPTGGHSADRIGDRPVGPIVVPTVDPVGATECHHGVSRHQGRLRRSARPR